MELMQKESIQIKDQNPQFDVILRFEQQTEEFFAMMIDKLAWVTGNTARLCSGQPPHVSMGIFNVVDNSDPIDVMGNVLRSLQPFSITFDVLGAFIPGTLVAAPVMTDEMIAMNRAIHAELAQAFDAAGLGWKPVLSRTVSISLVHHFPYTEELVKVFDLCGRGCRL